MCSALVQLHIDVVTDNGLRGGPLFLNEITQEMIGVRRLQNAIDGWTVSWTKECCILNFSRHRPGDDDILPPITKGVLIREEPDGGLIWSPRTNAVFKVDADAYPVS